MKTLNLILNLISCSLSWLMGTGLKGCTFNIRTPKTLILVEKGFAILPTEIPNLSFFRNLQQRGKAIILNGVVDFADSTPDDDLGKRSATGKEYLTLKHPYKWKFTFDNGLNFYKALNYLESNERYDLILLDDKGDMLLASGRDGSAKGLDLGLLSNGKYMIGNENSQSITVQIDRLDFDKNVSWIPASELDFSPTDLDGVNDISLAIAPLAVAGTSLIVTTLLGDKSHFVDGLILANFKVKKTTAGVTTTITPTGTAVADATAKTYTLTIPTATASTVYSVETFDSTLNVSTILTATGDLYRGNVATVTVP